MPRGSAPGERRGGRSKGVPNKLNGDIKAMIVGALQDVGGRDYLAARAIDTPTAFMSLVGRVLPLQLAGHDGGRLEVEFRWKDEPQPTTIDSVATDVDTAQDDNETPVISFIGEG